MKIKQMTWKEEPTPLSVNHSANGVEKMSYRIRYDVVSRTCQIDKFVFAVYSPQVVHLKFDNETTKGEANLVNAAKVVCQADFENDVKQYLE